MKSHSILELTFFKGGSIETEASSMQEPQTNSTPHVVSSSDANQNIKISRVDRGRRKMDEGCFVVISPPFTHESIRRRLTWRFRRKGDCALDKQQF